MKYYLHRTYPNDPIARKNSIVYYTYAVLEHVIKHYGHKLVSREQITKDTIVLFSMTTGDGVPELIRARKEFPDNIIAVGGHFATHFPTMLVWCDLVNIGQGFEFFQQDSLDAIKRLKCVAYKGKDEIIEPSDFIDWKLVPLANDSQKHFYYWGGVGCRNKCQYCYTSWTNRHQNNSEIRVRKACEQARRLGGSITITSNEYDYEAGATVRDMMLRQFIKISLPAGKHPKLIRLGIEFVTEEMRRKTGKFFTNDEYYVALEKAAAENKELNLFFITGMEPLQQVHDFVQSKKDFRMSPKIFHKFTNMVYSQFTPMFKKRFDMKPEYYAGPKFKDRLLRTNGETRRNRYIAIGHPRKAFYETALGCVTTEQEYTQIRKIKNAKTTAEAYDILMKSGVLENDFSPLVKFNLSKNRIIDPYHAEPV